MIALHRISEWLLDEFKIKYQNFKLYFIVSFVCLTVSFLVIYFCFHPSFEMVEELLMSKSGLGITLTGVISFLSSQIRNNELNEIRKRFLNEFGNSNKNAESKVNELVMKMVDEKLTLKTNGNDGK